MTDKTLQQAVLDELEWEPSVNSAHIGVTASNGIVTLAGHVPSYAEKFAAERAAERVTGVKGVAVELEVRYPFENKTDDAEIAKRALNSLEWNISVPANKVKVEVEKGQVTLSGEVDWQYQRLAAESDVRRLSGVLGVINLVKVKPHASAYDVRQKIKAALDRNAQIEANGISVTSDGGKVTLSGKVHSWHERNLAERTAWSAPGVTEVDDRLTIG